MIRAIVLATVCLCLMAPFQIRAADLKEKAMKDLTHRDPAKRAEAAELLGQFKYEPAVPALAAALKDKDDLVRVEAAYALWDIGDASSSAAPALREALQDPNGRVRLYAAGALRMLDEDEQKLIPPVRTVLDSANVWNRAYAATMLIKMEVPIKELVAAIDSVLGGMEHRKAKEYTLDLFSMKLDPVNTDPNIEAKRLLLEELQTQDLPPELMPTLEASLKDLDDLVRMRTIACLARIRPAPSDLTDRLIGILSGSKSADDRGAAIWELSRLKPVPAQAVPELITATKDKDEGVRSKACEALAEVIPAKTETIQALIAALGDKKTDVRRAAAEALGDIGPDAKAAVPALREMAAKEKDIFAQRSATTALERLGVSAP